MSDLITQYKENLPSYKMITEQFQTLLAMLLQRENLHIHAIRGRAKNIESLAGKIGRAGGKYGKLQDITDLCGLRIISYYEDEIDRIAAIIRQHFWVDEENSVDKRQKLAPDQFGYASLHLIVNLPVDKDPSDPQAQAYCKVEIQIRSLLQHAWAEIEHDLEYKNPAGTSSEIRRRFSRLAALLEYADSEFRALRDILKKNDTPALPPAPPKIPQRQTAIPGKLRQYFAALPNIALAGGAMLLFLIGAAIFDHYTAMKIEALLLLPKLFSLA